jgi:hypothetical protein
MLGLTIIQSAWTKKKSRERERNGDGSAVFATGFRQMHLGCHLEGDATICGRGITSVILTRIFVFMDLDNAINGLEIVQQSA